MCSADTLPQVACAAKVLSNDCIAPSVFALRVSREPSVPSPKSGQFFMLRARPSGVLLGRPISVYRTDDTSLTFLVLKKGQGTAELCGLRAGDSVDLVGPIGNSFQTPAELISQGLLAQSKTDGSSVGLRIAVIGGGIGVAPVAGFSLSLAPKTFDFYASFRSTPYGLDGLEERASKIIITTEDGSVGVKGMLPSVFDAAKYDLVYACGPTPMLRYIKEACAVAARVTAGENGANSANSARVVADGNGANSANSARVVADGNGTAGAHGVNTAPLAFLSLEQHMACGAGACLGCTVRTSGGNRRCCVDGPVFNAAEVIL